MTSKLPTFHWPDCLTSIISFVVPQTLGRGTQDGDENSFMVACSIPTDGDVIVRRERRDGMLVYVLHIAPGPDQYVLRTRKEGVAQALTFAKRQEVRAWFTDGGDAFVLLENVRQVESTIDE